MACSVQPRVWPSPGLFLAKSHFRCFSLVNQYQLKVSVWSFESTRTVIIIFIWNWPTTVWLLEIVGANEDMLKKGWFHHCMARYSILWGCGGYRTSAPLFFFVPLYYHDHHWPIISDRHAVCTTYVMNALLNYCVRHRWPCPAEPWSLLGFAIVSNWTCHAVLLHCLFLYIFVWLTMKQIELNLKLNVMIKFIHCVLQTRCYMVSLIKSFQKTSCMQR